MPRLAEHLIRPGRAQQGDPLQLVEHTTHLLVGGQQQEVFDIEDAGGLVGPLQQATQAAELPGEIAAEGGIGDAIEQLAGAADFAQLLLGWLAPEAHLLQIPVDIIDLFPHLGGDHIADLTSILAGELQAIEHAAGIIGVAHQKADHILGPPGGVELVEQFTIAAGID